MSILVSWALFLSARPSLCRNVCLPQKEAFMVGDGEVTSRSQQAMYLGGWQLLRAASSCPLSLPCGQTQPCWHPPWKLRAQRCPGAPCWPAGHLHLGLLDTGLGLLLDRTWLPCYLTSFSPTGQYSKDNRLWGELMGTLGGGVGGDNSHKIIGHEFW